SGWAVKIDNEAVNAVLPPELRPGDLMTPQPLPEMIFRWRGRMAFFACQRFDGFPDGRWCAGVALRHKILPLPQPLPISLRSWRGEQKHSVVITQLQDWKLLIFIRTENN